MHAESTLPPVDIRLTEAEAIALDYYRASGLDGWTALVAAIEDALADLRERDAQTVALGRLVSHGYARGRLDA